MRIQLNSRRQAQPICFLNLQGIEGLVLEEMYCQFYEIELLHVLKWRAPSF